ncbi:MAG TPA: 2OG-Fe(II) oxygenase family protein [Thermoanaerobaculia bacterium]|nr:2OG-Fe(II) oxygenase family protein [Thermoanaerobaculia bacterium]
MNDEVEVLELFPAVVTTCTLGDDAESLRRLREHILATRESEPEGLSKSNVGGWHSGRLQGPVIEDLERAILRQADDYARRLSWDLARFRLVFTDEGLWAVVNGRGATNALHIHQRAHLSGVYYVSTPKGCGDLIFEAPRPPQAERGPRLAQQTLKNVERLAALPREGMLVLFPSWLPHRVGPNQSDEERMAVSFNIALVPVEGAA